MAYWRASDARAKFSALLDAAETEGPQLIHREKQTFVVITREELERRLKEMQRGKRKHFTSAWDALRLPAHRRFDLKIPRIRGGVRKVDLS
jgi:prevent-host-death family protein